MDSVRSAYPGGVGGSFRTLSSGKGTAVLLCIECVGRRNLLIDADAQDLTVFIHTDDAANSLAKDVMEVKANEVVEMNEAALCDKADDAVLFQYLHGHQKVVWHLSGGEHEDSLFRENRVGRVVIDFYNAQLVEMVSGISV